MQLCSRRPVGDVGIGTSSALRFPQGSGYKIRVREYPRLPPRLRSIFARNPLFFVTFCTYERRKLLTSDPVHAAFVGFAEEAYRVRNIAVGRYVVIPDHVHLFVRGPDDFQLGPCVGMLKQALSKHIALAGASPTWQL